MSEAPWLGVVGMARSGRAAARLALRQGYRVYISDSGDSTTLRETARELEAEGAEVQLGGHSVGRLLACELLVVSPGIDPGAGVLADPRLAHIRRISELEFAFRFLNTPVIAITGTNGKSTTTALVSELLRRGGLHAPAAGNIGFALSEVAIQDAQPDWVVVEASSFQLAGIERFTPRIGVVTNLAPDHLDRYATVEAYYADKARLFATATDYSVWVLNADDPEVMKLPGSAPGRRFYFRTRGELERGQAGAFLNARQELILRLGGTDTRLARVDELSLLGTHNIANALAASIAAAAAEIPLEAIHEGLTRFRGLAHRLEVVQEREDVLWINDSKATNIASTRVALQSMTRPTVLLLGGKHKGEPYTNLLPDLGRVHTIIAYGEAAPLIEHDLSSHLHVERVKGGFDDVIERARGLARPGDAVLLSPACASFDMFANYEQRGDRFKALVTRQEAAGG